MLVLSVLRWLKRIVIFVLFLILFLLSLGMIYEQYSRYRIEREYPPPGEFIDIGGHQLHALKKGIGGPSVVFETGLGIDGHLSWYKVQDAVAEFTNTVSYDRAGVLWSERGENPKTARAISAELKTMLENGAIEPPYILVGHSLAGLTLRPFIDEYSEDIVGIVFVDVSHPHQFEVTPEELQGGPTPAGLMDFLHISGILRFGLNLGPLPTDDDFDPFATIVPHMAHRGRLGVRAETNNIEKIAKEVQSMTDFGDIPLVVLTGALPTRGDNINVSDETRQFMKSQWLEFQEDLLNLSSNSEQVLAMKSEHFVQVTEPELVIESIRELVEGYRKSR